MTRPLRSPKPGGSECHVKLDKVIDVAASCPIPSFWKMSSQLHGFNGFASEHGVIQLRVGHRSAQEVYAP